jgi:peptidoglycan/LPS O-acetylase OafA/YrhL
VTSTDVATTIGPQRANQLDGLRFFAFAAVLVHHAVHAPMLWAGVDVFFVLSGYLITSILLATRERRGYFRTFYARRFLRIFPPYYILLAIVFVFIARPGGGTAAVYGLYVSNINDAFRWVPRVGVLDPMWSLAIEEQFYLLWPLLVFLVAPKRLFAACVALVGVALAARYACTFLGYGSWPVYYLLPCRIDTLACGAMLAVLQRESPARFATQQRRGTTIALAAFAIFVALSIAVPTFRTGANAPLFNTAGYALVAIGAAGLIAHLINPATSLARLLAFRPFVYLGRISYALYLWHQLVLDEVRRAHLSPVLTTLAALAGCIAIASMSWFLVERPLLRYKDRRVRYV